MLWYSMCPVFCLSYHAGAPSKLNKYNCSGCGESEALRAGLHAHKGNADLIIVLELIDKVISFIGWDRAIYSDVRVWTFSKTFLIIKWILDLIHYTHVMSKHQKLAATVKKCMYEF